jgi:WD40 repeat protein
MNYPDSNKVPAIWEVGDVILDLYEVKHVFTGGGMGLVYRVHHRGWNMDLAVKSPRLEFFQTQAQIENFEREAETWVNLGLHPCTVSCYYVRRLGGIPRLFAEFIDKGSLADSIRSRFLYEGGPDHALERILDIAIQGAWGLHYAHEQGLIHQDVKPANILMSADGSAKVTDFGLAKAQAVAGENAVFGLGHSIMATYGGMTLAYCSPEQAEIAAQSRSGVAKSDLSRLTRRTDIWSWGVSIFEMFTGEPPCPVGGQAAAEALEAYLDIESNDPELPKMPQGMGNILRHCFKRSPADRPQEMLDVIRVLKEVFTEVTGAEYHRAEPIPTEALADTLNNRAVSLLDLGKQEEALKAFNEALRLHPGHVEATYNRGVTLWRTAQVTDVNITSDLKILRRAQPDHWRPAYLLGLVNLEMTDKESAVQSLGKAIELGGEDEVAVFLEQAKALSDKQASRFLRSFKGHKSAVTALCLSSDNLLALTGSGDCTLRLWDLATGQSLRTFHGHEHVVLSACFSSDYRWALSASCDNSIKLWNVGTGECVRNLQVHEYEEEEYSDPDTVRLNFACLSSDSKFVLSASDDALRFWDLNSGECLRSFEGESGAKALCLSSDNIWAFTGSNGWYGNDDKTVLQWHVETGKCVRTFEGHAQAVNSVCVTANNRLLLSGSDDRTLRVWDVATGRCLRILSGHSNAVKCVCLSADGSRAISGSDDGTMRVWDVGTGQCIRTFDVHTGGVHSVYLSSDKRWAISGDDNSALRLWDVRGLTLEEPRARPPLQICHVVSVGIAEDARHQFEQCMLTGKKALANQSWGEALSCASVGRSIPGYETSREAVSLWNASGLHCVRRSFRTAWHVRTFVGHTEGITSICISADNRLALSASRDKSVRLWDVQSGQCLRTFEGHTSSVNSVCFSSDHTWALSGSSDHSIILWEIATGRCVRKFEGHSDNVNCVCLSSDNKWALSGGGSLLPLDHDSTVRLWDVASGRCIRIFQGHKLGIRSVCFSSDHRWALSGSGALVGTHYELADNSIRLWDIATGRCARVFEGHERMVHAVQLSSDNRWVFSGSSDKTLRLWDIRAGECLQIFKGHNRSVEAVHLNADNRWALSGGYDKSMRLWHIAKIPVPEFQTSWHTFYGHEESVDAVYMSSDHSLAMSGGGDKTLKLWALDWDFETHESLNLDEGARYVLVNFLTLHIPYAAELPTDRQPTDVEVTRALTRSGSPKWSDSDFKQLLHTLACAGYGWLKPEGVRKELMNMAATWTDFAHRPLQAPTAK